MAACPSCGKENEADARFCSACGTALAAPAVAREARKTVTIVRCDVSGSTALGERIDPESLRRVMARYFDESRTALERHGGIVEKFIGDAVMAVFGIPELHEDDALRAVRAASELRERLAELNDELEHDHGVRLEVRTGVNTGEVVAGDPSAGHAFVTGDPVNVAARLEQAADPGEILIGETTRQLVRAAVQLEPAGPLELKGKAAAVAAYSLVRVVAGAPAFARHLDSPLVGRGRERRLLREAFERAAEERTCHLFTILGAAGIGKSRLAQELLAEIGQEATVLVGRCLPYGEGITYWPLVEILRELGSEPKVAQLLEGEEDGRLIVNRVFAAVGVVDDPAGAPEETFWAVRKLFEALARERPLVVAFDDLHWAGPTFLDLAEHLADWSRDAPILLLCLARPELLDARPGWAGGKLNATSLLLEPLSEQETETLIDNLLTRIAGDVRTRIAEAAEGNPLFVEQMLAMVAEDAAVAEVTIPPTIHALLAARLDRLPAGERSALERAAVIGKEFWRGAVAELSEDGGVGAALQALIRKELIRPHRSIFAGDEGFRFRHLLIRDSAYDGTPKELRAELHERFAGWIERQRSGYDEIVGYHLEQAFRYREELGPVDEHGRELAARAAVRLAAAGRHALSRGDMPAAASLLERAVALLPPREAGALELRLELAEALEALGDGARAGTLLAETIDAAAASGQRALELRAAIQRQALRVWIEPEGAIEKLRQLAESAIPELEELGDDLGLAQAWSALALVHVMALQAAASADANEQALAHARRAGDVRRVQLLLGSHGAFAYGPMPVEEALHRLGKALEEAAPNRRSEAWVLIHLALLHEMLGEADEARRLAARGRTILAELAMGDAWAATTMETAWIPLRAGNPAGAEEELRPAYETLLASGNKGALCGVAAVLAEALYALGRYDEAHRLTEESEGAAASDDIVAQVWWRSVRAKVLARRGDVEQAERLAREAVELSDPTDWISVKARALLELAEVLRLTGKPAEAVGPLERALALYEAKGNVVGAGKARTMLEELQPSPAP